jgi:Holliday junction resolvase RusA-like endonuclease
MRSYRFTVPGKPIPKKRPRFSRQGLRVVTYDAQKREKERFRSYIKAFPKEPFRDAVYLSVDFGMPIPKSTLKKNKKLMVDGDINHTKKPDIDNLIKFVMDACTGIFWVDDSQVGAVFACKFYSDVPETIVKIIHRGSHDTCTDTRKGRVQED